MIYLYDEAIVNDLKNSFNPNAVENPVVSVVSPDKVIDIAAQLQNDEITFPIVALTRNDDISIDTNLTNFTRMHKGVAAVVDPKTNNLYYEHAIPLNLEYSLTVLATNTADMDELIRELIFKYTRMYFLTITLPYEGQRKVRFGVTINTDSAIERSSGIVDYLESGQIYQSIIRLKCEGCVYVKYTPVHLKRTAHEIVPAVPTKSK